MTRPHAAPTRDRDRARASAGGDDLHLAVTSFGEIVVAVDARDVQGIDKRVLRPDGSVVPTVDLAVALGLPAPSGERHRLNVGVGALAWDLLVGTSFRIERVAPDQLHAVPAFLAGLEATHGLAGLVERPDGYGFVVELERVRGLAVVDP